MIHAYMLACKPHVGDQGGQTYNEKSTSSWPSYHLSPLRVMAKDSELPPKTKNPCCHKIDDPVGRNLVITIDGKQGWNSLGGTVSHIRNIHSPFDIQNPHLLVEYQCHGAVQYA